MGRYTPTVASTQLQVQGPCNSRLHGIVPNPIQRTIDDTPSVVIISGAQSPANLGKTGSRAHQTVQSGSDRVDDPDPFSASRGDSRRDTLLDTLLKYDWSLTLDRLQDGQRNRKRPRAFLADTWT